MSFGFFTSTSLTITLESLEELVPGIGEGFVRVYTTTPTTPPYLHLTAGQTGTLEGAPPYDCICMAFYQKINTEDGRQLFSQQAEGYGDMGGTGGSAPRELADIVDGQRVVLARVSLRLSNPGARTTALPLDKKAEVEELAKLAQAWWRSGTAVDDELRKVHVATLPVGLFDFFPSYWFLVQMPASPDPESLYMKALHVAARRRSVRLSLSMPDGDMAIVVAEALAAIPNCFPYSADTNHLKGGDRLGERFSRDLRPEHAGRIQVPGDCEDGAAEICTLAHALRTQAFKSPIVQAAQRVLRRYIVGQHFSAVRLGYSPGLEGYSTGGQLYAHSHVILLPVEHVARALRGGVTCVWGSEPRGVRGAELPVLCADGISLFGASPKEKHPCCTKPIVKSDLLRHYSPIGLDYYMFSSSFYLTAGQVETATGTPVRELVYRNGDKYGASFADILEGKYTLEPSTTFTARGEQLAQACTAYLTPVLPYRESAPPDTTKLVEVLGAKLAESQPATFVDTFFVQLIDFGDDKVLGGVKRQCGDYAVSVIVDSFAEGCACAQVFLAWG